MDRKLMAAIAEAMKEHDVALFNDVEPDDFYEEKARVALETVEGYVPTRVPAFHVEGVRFL